MNHDIPPFDDHASEREWQAQERAVRAERLGLDANGDDARVRRYRLVARALRQPPGEALPDDFARQVAARVEATPRMSPATDGRAEWALLSTLAGILVLAGGITLVLYGQAWLPAIHAAWPAGSSTTDPAALRWALAFAACLGFSWLMGAWQRYARHGNR